MDSRIIWLALAIGSATLIGGAAYLLQDQFRSKDTTIRFSTGQADGVYHQFAEALSLQIKKRYPRYNVLLNNSAGSSENMQRLAAGTTDFALVQDDASANSSVRTVATLYREYLHILLPVAGAENVNSISSLQQLNGKRLYIGAENSGTEQAASALLKHFSVSFQRVVKLDSSPETALKRGTIDAVFLLTSLPSKNIDQIVKDKHVRLMGLMNSYGEALNAGFAAADPRYQAVTIEAGNYGIEQSRDIHTVAVNAVLTAHSSVDADVVNNITRLLFTERLAITENLPGIAGLREDYRPQALRFPAHPGAVSYYQRRQPPFLVAYAEAIALAITVLGALLSLVLAWRQWAQRASKERIDIYYFRIMHATEKLLDAPLAEQQTALHTLTTIRNDAFTALAAEKLLADQSFAIFQRFVNDELAAVERRIQRLASAPT